MRCECAKPTRAARAVHVEDANGMERVRRETTSTASSGPCRVECASRGGGVDKDGCNSSMPGAVQRASREVMCTERACLAGGNQFPTQRK